MAWSLFITAPKGLESLLAVELEALGARAIKETRAGVSAEGEPAIAYRICLWSRLANRVLLPLRRFPAPDPDALYAGVQDVDWNAHLAPDGTLAVDFTTVASRITHSHFGALKVKDAVVDQFRARFGQRPSVAVLRPDVRINLHLQRNSATLSLDLSGESLHRRGYRKEAGEAPLKENLAAAILLRAGWPEVAAAGGPLLDPMCGSGTLPIEAALMAGDVAPGLLRDYFGFLGWRGHDAGAWAALRAEAAARREEGLHTLPPIIGCDADPRAVRVALANVERAGLHGRVHIERRDLAHLTPPAGPPGLVVVNPPYGQRLGEMQQLVPLYQSLGETLRERFAGWRAAVFTGNPELGRHLGLRVSREHSLFNGPIACRLLHLDLSAPPPATAPPAAAVPQSPGARMFANRLSKNVKELGRWARREGVDCYRVYDADMPEYAVAVDLYQGEGRWVHVQEYEAPPGVDPGAARARLREALAVIPAVLHVDPSNVFFKVRRRQRGRQQYEKLQAGGRFLQVREGNCRFLVNFTDYLDTGLFLDHRPTRALIQRLAAGRHFLNLFGYTGTATVHAALGGASSTTTVDLSKVYLDWAQRNLALNGVDGPQHRLVQADVLQWLAEQAAVPRRYGLIFLDPPTHSRSKRMQGEFDVQRDHVPLIRAAARVLDRDGLLVFSTNFRKFKLDAAALADLQVEDITRRTVPRDFARNPKVHYCWLMRPWPEAGETERPQMNAKERK